MNQLEKPMLVRLPAVVQTTGLGRSTLYRLISAGQFPVPLRLSHRSVAWRLAEVEAWVESRQRAH
jgi:prophage regulatory protein